FASAKVFARKWSAALPIGTPCAMVDGAGALRFPPTAVTASGLLADSSAPGPSSDTAGQRAAGGDDAAPATSGPPAARAVVWEGAQDEMHSLALVNRQFCLRLIERGHE